ncbi:methyltransferase-like protein 22 isoform X4 [Protopterus annectens]|uniref:methyltransferase-like protein 22 isoform X4 n=1 Tax=Protopterus annectens TaxID=7888 RepID=UPI001CFC1476|nr:methyltransferase-like protein 22 isoform X4 [Protopterus annectens]
MDVIRFTCDTVLSDVHLLMPNSQHFGEAECSGTASVPFKIQNSKDCDNFDGKESYQSKLVGGNRNESHDPSEEPVEVQNCKTTGDSEPCNESVEVTVVQNLDALLDEDGDLDLIRRPLDVSDTDQLEFYRLMVHPVILSKGEEGTREVEDQYDSYPDVIRIDVGDDLLNMCEKNVTLNRHLAEQMGEIQVKELDWLQSDFCLDPEFPYSWSEDEIASLHDDTTVLLAADVCYDSSLTDALFRTIYKIMSNLKNPSTLYISIEKRFNFTLRHMDITCEAYDHFRSCLNDLEHITDGKTKFTVESVPITFPQHLDYERFEHLELWKVTASPVST